MLFNWVRIFSSALHHPRNVDSGTPISRATAALDSPLCTLFIASIFSCGVSALSGRLPAGRDDSFRGIVPCLVELVLGPGSLTFKLLYLVKLL